MFIATLCIVPRIPNTIPGTPEKAIIVHEFMPIQTKRLYSAMNGVSSPACIVRASCPFRKPALMLSFKHRGISTLHGEPFGQLVSEGGEVPSVNSSAGPT